MELHYLPKAVMVQIIFAQLLTDSCEGDDRSMAKGVRPAFPDPVMQHDPRGLGVDEEKTRGVHQGWEATVLPDKAEYMSATESCFVMIPHRLANGDGPYMLHNSGKHLIFLSFWILSEKCK
jgi:hypothetical protein